MANTNNKTSLLGRLFGNRNKNVDNLVEEQIQSPGRMMLNNFLHNPLGMTGLIIFLAILIFVVVGPYIFHLDLGDTDNTQLNVPPTSTMLSVPAELDGNIQAIAAGTTFGVGCDKNGKTYIWGYTKITDTIDLKNIPQEVLDAKIVDVAAGYDHVVALDDEGNLYVWGSKRLGQDRVPSELKPSRTKGPKNIIQIEAGFQISGAVTDEGEAYFWGNSNMADIDVKKAYQGHIKKIAIATYNYCLLLDDGSVVYGGTQKNNAFTNIPAELGSGVVDIAATGESMAAVKDNGKIVVWGNATHGEKNVPESESRPVELYGGRYHYTALMENGDVFSWGDNSHNQSNVPAAVNGAAIDTVYAGFYQNYAVDVNGKVHTWGLKGHLLGTDNMGRDVLTRIVNGGQVTMTVGAVSVIIALVIGVVMGGIAGYFGGKADMLIMRISEVVGGLPFLPFALLLSAIIGTRISAEMRM